MHVLLTSFPLCRDGSRDEMLWERLGWYREGLRVPSILSESFTKSGGHATVFMNFYRKSAGVSTGSAVSLLQDVV